MKAKTQLEMGLLAREKFVASIPYKIIVTVGTSMNNFPLSIDMKSSLYAQLLEF